MLEMLLCQIQMKWEFEEAACNRFWTNDIEIRMENVQTIISRYLELYSVHTKQQNDTELSPKELIMNTNSNGMKWNIV